MSDLFGIEKYQDEVRAHTAKVYKLQYLQFKLIEQQTAALQSIADSLQIIAEK